MTSAAPSTALMPTTSTDPATEILMTTETEIRVADVDPAPPPRCQVRWQCPDKCCPPTRCPDHAEYRVSFRCASPACDHAVDLLLLCERCTGQADAIGPVLARRPL